MRGLEPDTRRAAYQHESLPLIQALKPWLRAKLETISQKTKLAEPPDPSPSSCLQEPCACGWWKAVHSINSGPLGLAGQTSR